MQSHVDRAACDAKRCFLHALGEGGVGVAGAGDVFGAGAKFDGYREFGY
jgi:hypothetical protein